MKRVVIVGASSGIGLTLAEAFASKGVPTALAARHTKVLALLKQKYPDNVEYASIDVTHRNAPAKLNQLIEKIGGMDIYFHVAGIGYESIDLDPEREASIVDTNAVGFTRMIDAAYRYFTANRKRGHITAVTSVAGTKGTGRLAAYSASKAFGQAYITALRQLACMEHSGVTFTDVRPGWTRTPLLHDDAVYPMTMNVDEVVCAILRATLHKWAKITVDWRWFIVASLWRLIPDVLWVRMPVNISMPDAKIPDEVPDEESREPKKAEEN